MKVYSLLTIEDNDSLQFKCTSLRFQKTNAESLTIVDDSFLFKYLGNKSLKFKIVDNKNVYFKIVGNTNLIKDYRHWSFNVKYCRQVKLSITDN